MSDLNLLNTMVHQISVDNKPSISALRISNTLELSKKLHSWGLSPLPCGSYLKAKKAPADKGETITHGNYQRAQPSPAKLSEWFSDTSNGIGFLCGVNGLYMIDFDIEKMEKPGKGFENRYECKVFADKLIEKFPQLNSWVDVSPSGGIHIAVRLKTNPGFTNFAHKDYPLPTTQLGEILGDGRYIVIAPTEGYICESFPGKFEDIPEFESLEELGFIKVSEAKKETKKKDKVVPINRSVVELEATTKGEYEISTLISRKVKDLLKGMGDIGDRSNTLTTVIKEVFGWANWLTSKGYSHSDNPQDIATTCGSYLGLDEAKIERIFSTVTTQNCLPAIHYLKGDDGCEAKLRGLGREYNQVTISVEQTIFEDLFGGDSEEYVTIASSFYRYTGNGYYQIIEEEVVKKMITDRLPLLFEKKLVKGSWVISYKAAKEGNKENSFKYCRTALTVEPDKIKTTYRCFEDCTVDMLSGDTLPHSKEHYLTTSIPYPYKKISECPKVFSGFIEQSYGLDLLPLIRAVASMLIDPTTPFGKFVSLTGDSGSGKGTLLRLLVQLCGDQNSTSLPNLGILENPDKCFQYLAGRSLVVSPDLQTFQKDLGNFYELVDNGFISGRPLHSNTTYNKKWYVRFVMAYVGVAKLENSGGGWDRRCIAIPTLKRQNKTDPRLGEKLESELGSILSWVLAIDKTERDELLFGSTKFEQIEKQKRLQSISSSSVKQFIDSCLIPGEEHQEINKDDMYSMYVAFCKHTGVKAKQFAGFVQDMKADIPQCRVEGTHKKVNSKTARVAPYWKGVRQESFTKDEMRGEWVCTKTSEGYLDMFLNPDAYVDEVTKVDEEQPKIFVSQAEKNLDYILSNRDNKGLVRDFTSKLSLEEIVGVRNISQFTLEEYEDFGISEPNMIDKF